jgi:protein-tyrosine-phosphatase
VPSILFVCQGNIFRSVLAAGLFQDMLKRSNLEAKSWRIESAGTWASPNQPTSDEVLALMAGRGIDFSQHRSRRISAKILAGFNLILTMERGQKEALQIEFPSAAKRIYLLTEMAGENIQVADPMDTSLRGIQALTNEIEGWLYQGWERMVSLAQHPG